MKHLTWQDYFASEEDLISIRKELYGSNSPGYFIFKNFISEEFVKHIFNFWVHEFKNESSFKKITEMGDKKELFYRNCPNYQYVHNYGQTFYNFGFNEPVDEASHAVAFSVNHLRNLVEAKCNYQYMFLTDEFQTDEGGVHAWAYRAVFTKNGDKIVKPHRDWLEGKLFKPERLQATLFLSKKGVDYTGKGMFLESNNGKETYIFDENVEVNPGDLVLWHYNNLHSIEDIKSTESQSGFFRFIFPPEVFYAEPTKHILSKIESKDLMKEIKDRFMKKTGLKK